jgi:2,3-bisphosphoglycerate-dependent phosphoglycerate mutase
MIEPTRILALRHGRTAWNAEQRIQGHTDVPLDATGRWQAAQAAQALADEGITAIYSSDLLRARATAEAVAQRIGLPVQCDAKLRERAFGDFEGLRHADIEQRHPEAARRWRQRERDFGPGGGETLLDFYARSVDAATRLAARHPGEAIVVVTHGGVLDCLYRAATRVELGAARTWQLGNASINRLLYAAGGFVLVGWDDAGHLVAPEPQAPPGG